MATTPSLAEMQLNAAEQKHVSINTQSTQSWKRRLFSADGRIGRLRLLTYGVVVSVAFTAIFGVVSLLLGLLGEGIVSMIIAIVTFLPLMIVMIISMFVLTIKRLHDLNKIGWLSLILIVPVLGLLFQLWLIVWPGTKEDNEYGSVPAPNTIWHAIVPSVYTAGLLVSFVTMALPVITLMMSMQGLSNAFQEGGTLQDDDLLTMAKQMGLNDSEIQKMFSQMNESGFISGENEDSSGWFIEQNNIEFTSDESFERVEVELTLNKKLGLVTDNIIPCFPQGGAAFETNYESYACGNKNCKFRFSGEPPSELIVFEEDNKGQCNQKVKISTAGRVKLTGYNASFEIPVEAQSKLDPNKMDNVETTPNSAGFAHIAMGSTAKVYLSYSGDSPVSEDEFMIGGALFSLRYSSNRSTPKFSYSSEEMKSAISSNPQRSTDEQITLLLEQQQSTQPEDSSLEGKIIKTGYQDVSYNQAINHIGRLVIVKRNSGKDLEGKLVSASGGTLKVQQRRYGGTVDFPIKSSNIKSIEVYLRNL